MIETYPLRNHPSEQSQIVKFPNLVFVGRWVEEDKEREPVGYSDMSCQTEEPSLKQIVLASWFIKSPVLAGLLHSGTFSGSHVGSAAAQSI